MWQDPIVKETRELRKQYAAKFNHDPDAIFEDIRNRQNKSGRKCVAFPARRPKSKQKIAERIRLDFESVANQNLNRLLDKPDNKWQ